MLDSQKLRGSRIEFRVETVNLHLPGTVGPRVPWVPEVSRGPLSDLPAEGRPMSAQGRLTSGEARFSKTSRIED